MTGCVTLISTRVTLVSRADNINVTHIQS